MLFANYTGWNKKINDAMANIICRYTDYCGSNQARVLAHGMKENKVPAIRKIANDLSDLIAEDCVLIPIPNKIGFPLNTLMLGNLMRELVRERNIDVKVSPVIIGSPRQSVYDAKKEGKQMNEHALNFSLHLSPPEAKKIYLLDNVIATGLTAYSALKLVPSADVLVHSVDKRTFQQSAYRKEFGSILTLNPHFLKYKQKHRIKIK